MNVYTVEIQAGSEDRNQWQAVLVADRINGESAEDVARDTAGNQNLAAAPGPWRVVVWEGDRTDGSKPQVSEAAYVLDYPGVSREIGWTEISEAGIPLGVVQRYRSPASGTWEGHYEAISADVQRRVVFGPQADPQNVCQPGEHPGWAMARYVRVTEDEDGVNPWEAEDSQEWIWYEPDALTEMLENARRHLEEG